MVPYANHKACITMIFGLLFQLVEQNSQGSTSNKMQTINYSDSHALL